MNNSPTITPIGPRQFGGNWQSKLSQVALPGNKTVQLVVSSQDRYAIYFMVNSGAGQAWVGPTSRVANGFGIPILPTTLPLRFLFAEDGGLVQSDWWAYSNAGAQVTILEGIWLPYVKGL